jgi:chromatin assembly factor 1 subunit B
MLASSDGYCSIVIFDEFLPLYHSQQHNMQLQAIASSVSTPQHSHPALPNIPSIPNIGVPWIANTGNGSGPGPAALLNLGTGPNVAQTSFGAGTGGESTAIGLNLSTGVKRSEPSSSPEASTVLPLSSTVAPPTGEIVAGVEEGQPKKKKRRIQPTQLGSLD